MAEVTQDKIVKLLKGDNDLTQGKVAQKLGVTVGQVPMILFCKAQVEAGIFTKQPATPPSVVKLRNAGNRWELIAARTNLGVAAVKAKFKEGGGGDPAKSYSGRGRNFNGSTAKKPAATGRQTGKKTPTGGRQTGGRATAATGGGRRTSRNPS